MRPWGTTVLPLMKNCSIVFLASNWPIQHQNCKNWSFGVELSSSWIDNSAILFYKQIPRKTLYYCLHGYLSKWNWFWKSIILTQMLQQVVVFCGWYLLLRGGLVAILPWACSRGKTPRKDHSVFVPALGAVVRIWNTAVPCVPELV